MEQVPPEASPSAVAALAILRKVILDPKKRMALSVDPSATLEKAGVRVRDIPSQLFETLTDFSYDELSLVARYDKALIESGLTVEMPEGSVSFF